jgi:hypothetical protein
MLRICDAFRTSVASFLRGLDRGIYEHEEISPFLLKKLATRAKLKRKWLLQPRGSA